MIGIDRNCSDGAGINAQAVSDKRGGIGNGDTLPRRRVRTSGHSARRQVWWGVTDGRRHRPRLCAARARPAPLIISGGAATTTQGEVTYTGAVMGDGRMTLRSAAAYIMNGKVDSSGVASATVTTSHGCTFSFVWKKQ